MRCARLPCEALPPYQRLGVCVIIFKPLAALSLGEVAEHAAHKLMVWSQQQRGCFATFRQDEGPPELQLHWM